MVKSEVKTMYFLLSVFNIETKRKEKRKKKKHITLGVEDAFISFFTFYRSLTTLLLSSILIIALSVDS